ncbi:MAG TPA: hypothetical protein VME41_06955 [Stellaceae bacterium]|nr:hypothetical protein [Stellaceae bacterium]
MKRTRYKPIADVVLTKDDLSSLLAVLRRRAAADGAGFVPTITILSDGGAITETDDPTIFDDDVVDHRSSKRIELRYSDHRAKRISVVLEEADRGSWHKSAFTVTGDDAAWVDAAFAELERLFAAVRPQSRILARVRWAIIIPAAIAIAYSWTVVLSRNVQLLLPAADGQPAPSAIARFFGEHRLLLYETFLILFCLPWLALARSLVGWVERLWPTVEFDFGPDRRNRRARVRFRLAVITGLLVLPILIALVNRRGFGPP